MTILGKVEVLNDTQTSLSDWLSASADFLIAFMKV